jgi:hypothetical protein
MERESSQLRHREQQESVQLNHTGQAGREFGSVDEMIRWVLSMTRCAYSIAIGEKATRINVTRYTLICLVSRARSACAARNASRAMPQIAARLRQIGVPEDKLMRALHEAFIRNHNALGAGPRGQYRYYACSRRRHSGTSSNALRIRVEEVDEVAAHRRQHEVDGAGQAAAHDHDFGVEQVGEVDQAERDPPTEVVDHPQGFAVTLARRGLHVLATHVVGVAARQLHDAAKALADRCLAGELGQPRP